MSWLISELEVELEFKPPGLVSDTPNAAVTQRLWGPLQHSSYPLPHTIPPKVVFKKCIYIILVNFRKRFSFLSISTTLLSWGIIATSLSSLYLRKPLHRKTYVTGGGYPIVLICYSNHHFLTLIFPKPFPKGIYNGNAFILCCSQTNLQFPMKDMARSDPTLNLWDAIPTFLPPSKQGLTFTWDC